MPSDVMHPRPQLTRERWTDLCGPWGFASDDSDTGVRDGWVTSPEPFNRTIIVPFPPESRASGIGEPGFHPVVWYRRTFRVAPENRTGRWLLHFGAVDYRATVWVNGSQVAEHEGGHTPFSANITPVLREGDSDQVVVVRAEDHPEDLTQPRGKQDWQPAPHKIWYHRTTGIWQPVWLEPVPAVSITDLRWTPDLDRGLLGMRIRLDRPAGGPLHLRIHLSLRGQTLADDTCRIEGIDFRREIGLESATLEMGQAQLLWSPRRPNLVDAELTLLDGEQVVDRVRSYAGLRSCGVADGRFLLNGRPFFPRLVLAQNYWPESHLAAPNAGALRREVELVKELGFNGVRIHQKVEDPRFLAWCDRLGVLVWGEMANAYVFSPEAVERLTREWLSVLRRDHSHPCIVTWMPVNESWGVPALARDPAQQAFVRGLYGLTKALDQTRPVIGNDGWEHVASDIWGIHDYTRDGATICARYGSAEAVERTLREVQPHSRSLTLPPRSSGEPVMITEFGGVSLAPRPGEQWHGYGTVDDTDAFLATYKDLIGAVLDCPTVAGFCYTQLTDTEQETNGLLTEDRVPKVDQAAICAINERPSQSIPSDIVAAAQRAAEITTFQGTGG